MADRQCQHDPHSESCSGLHGLLAIMERLRHPDTGCPWDIEQDFASIAPHTIEEAYEVADAIARKDWEGLQDELGDLLFQIVFHAQMAAERGIFTFAQVVAGASAKMVARHPHIFAGESRDKTAAQQSRDWEAHKAQERQAKQQRGALDGVALGLPALVRAVKLQNRATRVGFDCESAAPPWAKAAGDAQEAEAAQSMAAEALPEAPPEAHLQEALGEYLFALANWGRRRGIDPEAALRGANAKFARRFQQMEAQLAALGKGFEDLSLSERKSHWAAAKENDGAPEKARNG